LGLGHLSEVPAWLEMPLVMTALNRPKTTILGRQVFSPAAPRRWIYYSGAFFNGFTIPRTRLRKSWASGLSDRLFNVMIAT
jgi:hypothetical protein